MFYFAEGWFLFKRTWWATVRLAALGLLLVLPLSLGLAASIVVMAVRDTNPIWFFLPVTLFLLAELLLLAPGMYYAWWAVLSAPYYPEPIRVWRLFKRGFAHWAKMIGVGLYGTLFSLPLLVVAVMFVWGLTRLSDAPSPNIFGLWTTWLWLLTSPFSAVFGFYGTFASLNAVRTNSPAWRSWMDSFRLVPYRQWLRTLGLLAAINLPFYFLQVARQAARLTASATTVTTDSLAPSVSLPILMAQFAIGVFVSLATWYLSLCVVAVWHRYTVPPSTEAEPLDSESVPADAETVPQGAEPV